MHRLFLLLVLISSASAQFTPPTYTPSNTFTNAASTGTALNKLAKLNAANTVVRTATTDTDTALGICVTNCGTTGKSVIQWAGIVSCVFDGATTLGHWVTISSTTAGDCHDAGSTRPASSQVIGVVTTTNGGGGTYPVNLQLSGPLPVAGSGTVTSITLSGTSNQITVSGTCTVTTSGTCTFALPSGLVLPGTINKLTLTAPATGATVTILDGKTFTVNKTLTLDGSDGVTITFPASNATVATLGLTNTFTGRQDASGAASTAPAKVGTSLPASCLVGDAYFKSDATAGSNFYGCTSLNTWTLQGGGGSGTVTSVTIAGTSNQITIAGTCTITTTGTCTLSLPSGLQIPGTINKLTLTQPATGSTITVLDGKTITVNKTITFDGTDGVTITFPASSATVATIGLTNTFTGRQDASGAASTAPGKVGTSLPGTCTVGDVYFKSDATAGSNWYGCTSSNTWTVQGSSTASASGMTLLYSATASSSATLSATTRNVTGQSGALFQTDFKSYELRLVNIVPATDAANLTMQFSSDGGSTWIAANYYWSYQYSSNSTGFLFSSSDSVIHLGNANSSGTGASISGFVQIYGPLSGVTYPQLTTHFAQANSAGGPGDIFTYVGSGALRAQTAVNALKILFSAGNIASGELQIYGLSR